MQQTLLGQKRCLEIFKRAGVSNSNGKKAFMKGKQLVASAGGAGIKSESAVNQIEFFAALRECVSVGGIFQEFADNPPGSADYSDSEDDELVEGFGADGFDGGAGGDAAAEAAVRDGAVYVGGSAPLYPPPGAGGFGADGPEEGGGTAIRRKGSLLGGNFGGASASAAIVTEHAYDLSAAPLPSAARSAPFASAPAQARAPRTPAPAPAQPVMTFAERQEAERQAAAAAFRQSLDMGRSPDRQASAATGGGGGGGGGGGFSGGGSVVWDSKSSSSPAGAATAANPAGPPVYDIVLSHAAEDTEMVDALEKTLSAAGLRVWRAAEDSAGSAVGGMFQRSAGWAIPGARCFVPIISSAFGNDDACIEDLSLAHLMDKPVVAFSLVDFDDLKIDFYSRMKLSATSIIYATSKNMAQAYAELGSSLALVEAFWADTARSNPTNLHVYHRTAWAPVPVPEMAKLPWWTSTFGHVEEVPWQQFVDSVFSSLPILQTIPNPLDLEKVLARVFPPFGPETPKVVTRPMMRGDLGVSVDGVLEEVAQSIINLFLHVKPSCSTQTTSTYRGALVDTAGQHRCFMFHPAGCDCADRLSPPPPLPSSEISHLANQNSADKCLKY